MGPPPSAIHGGGRLSRHPCRSAHSTRPAFSLHQSRDWWCLDFLRMKIKSTATATACASKLAPTGRESGCRTASAQTGPFPAEAGPTKKHRVRSVGPASAGKLLILISVHKKPSHRQSRLGCRLNAGLAQWAEPHGCGESAVRTWMSVRSGPTERDRSEGTPRHEGPNQEQAPLVTWGWCDFRLFQVTRRRRNGLPLGRRS